MPEPASLARQHVTMVLNRSTTMQSVLAGCAAAGLVTMVSAVALDHRLPDIVMLYLLAIVFVAIRFGYAASLIAATLSVGAVDYFFTDPYFSFTVRDKRYYLTFAIMLLVAFIISNLMNRIQRSAAAVREREVRTARLYAMSREVSITRSSEDIARIACRHLRGTFASDVSMLVPDEATGKLRRAGDDGSGAPSGWPSSEALAVAQRTIADEMASAWPSHSIKGPSGEDLVLLHASRGTLGVLVIHSTGVDLFARPANRELLDAYASHVALAMERAQLAEDAERAQLEVQRERLRNALLSSVSHDLRTPLAVVKGAVTALLDRNGYLSESRRQEYLETISDEANRLNRLVRNLLNMTSLEAGALRARKEWQPLEEVVGVALNRLGEQLEGRRVPVRIEPGANLVPFDATLLEQVLLNLVENALRYTPPESPIEIQAVTVDGGVEIEVADRGPGVPDGQEEQIFEKFRRAAPVGASGMGLGLTICRGIVSVHGGRIWCSNRTGGGASFRFYLPRETDAPAMDGLPDAVGDA